MTVEEGTHKYQVGGYSCRTAHHRYYKHCKQAAFAVFNGACCHDCRDIAAESHYHRDETLAVQSHLMHKLIHDKGSTRHVTAVFHK